MPVYFKLKFGEETRRLTFPELPSWGALFSRLTAVYGIPPERDSLGVSYTDLDGDEITLNTDEELLDYYKTFDDIQPGQPFRLKVVDLSSLRGDTSLSPIVHTQVGPLAFEVDDDWQRLPSLPGLTEMYIGREDTGQDSLHAFVQVVESDNESIQAPRYDQDAESATSTIHPTDDKGKGREDMTFPSTVSLIDEESEAKYPIHVLDRSHQVVDESTFAAHVEDLEKDGLEETTSVPPSLAAGAASAPSDEDPPLPTIDDNPSTPPSLTEDISLLIASLSTAIITNPELSNTFSRIMHNTRSGSYWRAHRDTLSQTVNDISQSIGTTTEEFRRNAEADAARNISQTLGNLFSSLSAASHGSANPTTVPDSPRASPHMPGGFPRPHSWRHGHFRPSGPPPPHPPFGGHPIFPHGPFGHHPPPHPFVHGGPFGHHPHHPPFHRPDPAHAPDVIDTVVSTTNEDPGTPTSYPSAPPKGPSRFAGVASTALSGEASSSNADKIWDPELRPSWLPPPPLIEDRSEPAQGKPNPQELRASVEAAKQRYKEEKERYRREKGERRRQRDIANMTPALNSSIIPLSREVSGDGSLPQSLERSASQGVYRSRGFATGLDMSDSLPRRATISSIKRPSEDFNSRALTRILKRLAEMGFTEASDPDLPAQIKSHVPSDKALTKDDEDNIVTSLLEELLAKSSKVATPFASGSGI